MKLSEFKEQLKISASLNFVQPDGKPVPSHFHITEVGLTTKHFIDCGGVIHVDKYANLQIWVAQDTTHRLEPQKMLKIIEVSEKVLAGEDLELEIEYQAETIGRYGLETDGEKFLLTAKKTDCLASAECGVPKVKQKVSLKELVNNEAACCTPGGGCC